MELVFLLLAILTGLFLCAVIGLASWRADRFLVESASFTLGVIATLSTVLICNEISVRWHAARAEGAAARNLLKAPEERHPSVDQRKQVVETTSETPTIIERNESVEVSNVAVTPVKRELSLDERKQEIENKRNELLARFPLISLEQRLDYEPDGPGDVAPQTTWRDNKPRGYMLGNRGYLFWSLHERTVQAFEEYPGRGISRLMPISTRHFNLPKTEPVPLPSPAFRVPEERDVAALPLLEYAQEVATDLQTPVDYVASIHKNSIKDFLNPDRFGWVKRKKLVTGFESHRFAKMPQMDANPENSLDRWHVEQLQLVSLLKHSAPCVYISDNLPFMDELKDAPIRPLSEFEIEALKRIQESEDVVVRLGDDRIYMLGAIRANNDCLACHTTFREALLGAFSYQLVRMSGQSDLASNE